MLDAIWTLVKVVCIFIWISSLAMVIYTFMQKDDRPYDKEQ